MLMNKEKSSLIYSAIICFGLILLVLWIFFDAAFGKPAPKKQREISVILYSAGTNGWESFQEGIKQAEKDFWVNINTVILRAEADAEEQFEIMKREEENGAEALVIAVTDYEELYQKILSDPISVPIVTVESGLNDLMSFVSADNYEMGKRLGEEILKDFSGKNKPTIALSDEVCLRDSVEQRKQGFLDAVEGKAKIISLRVAENGMGADAAVGLHKESVLSLSQNTHSALKKTKFYGIGNTPSIVAALDQGKFEKLVFQNEFNMGYLAIKRLLEELDGIQNKDREQIDFYCISSEELYDTQYERLLFPIVE